jgi:hypothetical protein
MTTLTSQAQVVAASYDLGFFGFLISFFMFWPLAMAGSLSVYC